MRRDARTDRALLRRLTHDLVQRSPSAREQRIYVGMPVERVVGQLLRKRETMEVWLEEELFYFLLLDNFRPRTKAIASLPERLRRKKVTVHSATAEILLSTGFSLRNPGNDTFVTVVLEQCLGIAVQDREHVPTLEAGKQMYDGRRAKALGQVGSSQADFVKIVLGQRSFTQHLLDRHHRRVLGAPLLPKRAGPKHPGVALVDRLHGAPPEFFPILGEWLCSAGYAAAVTTSKRVRNDRQFVRSLYTDLLGRQPTYDELRNMRNALQSMADSTPLRSVMAKVILDSGDAQIPDLEKGQESAFVRECFERYLARVPRQDEEAKFVHALRQKGATRAHVVRALLGSVEYQLY